MYSVQVIPAEVDHIDFTWEAKKGSAVPYKITFIHAPSKAMDNPSVNISTEGIVPTHTDKFRLFFPCTGKVAEQVETLFQVSNLEGYCRILFLLNLKYGLNYDEGHALCNDFYLAGFLKKTIFLYFYFSHFSVLEIKMCVSILFLCYLCHSTQIQKIQ